MRAVSHESLFLELFPLGIAFLHKVFIPKDQYQPALWEQFKKERFMVYGAHSE